MVIDPGWQDRIWVYRYKGAWLSVDAITDGRAQGKHEYVLANPYTLAALCNRYAAGKDVPTWAVAYVERALGLLKTA